MIAECNVEFEEETTLATLEDFTTASESPLAEEVSETLVPRRIVVRSEEDYEKLRPGDLTKVQIYTIDRPRWMVYEGKIGGREAFLTQSKDNLTNMISWRCDRKQILATENLQGGIYLPPVCSRENYSYTPDTINYGVKYAMQEKAGLLKHLVESRVAA